MKHLPGAILYFQQICAHAKVAAALSIKIRHSAQLLVPPLDQQSSLPVSSTNAQKLQLKTHAHLTLPGVIDLEKKSNVLGAVLPVSMLIMPMKLVLHLES